VRAVLNRDRAFRLVRRRRTFSNCSQTRFRFFFRGTQRTGSSRSTCCFRDCPLLVGRRFCVASSTCRRCFDVISPNWHYCSNIVSSPWCRCCDVN
jgi:hypothetical protein